jgi:hypothetical protein
MQADTTYRGTDPNVTPAMIQAQQDAKKVGTPAWWRSHSTADGQPLSAAGKRS